MITIATNYDNHSCQLWLPYTNQLCLKMGSPVMRSKVILHGRDNGYHRNQLRLPWQPIKNHACLE